MEESFYESIDENNFPNEINELPQNNRFLFIDS